MGADSGLWTDASADSIPEPKIMEIGPLMIGFAGPWRAANLLNYGMEDLPEKVEDPMRYLVREFIPRFRTALSEGGAMGQDDDKEERWGGNMLVAIQAKLHFVSGYFCVSQTARGYMAAGNDAAVCVAQGVLTATRGVAPQERLRLALAAGEEHTNGVLHPFVFKEQRMTPLLSATA